MSDANGAKVDFGAAPLRISGGGSRALANEIAQGVKQGLGDGIKSVDASRSGHLDLGNLKLRLPPGAGAREVARALERAIRDAIRDKGT